MRIPLARLAPPLAFVALFGSLSAHADVYTWVDAAGRINVSNLTPPEGARITNVVHEDADAAARVEAARSAAREKELQALSERVRQLENELASAPRFAPPPPPYAAIPAPPVQNPVAVAAPVVQLTVAPASLTPAYGCDPGFDCGIGWGSPFYYPGVAFVTAPPSRHFKPVPRMHQAPWLPLQPIMQGPGGHGPVAPIVRGPQTLRRG